MILASQEKGVMRILQIKAAQYSRSMKIITVLTLVYLPPMFGAVSTRPWIPSYVYQGFLTFDSAGRACSAWIS
jgi:hypothetical protein